MTPEEARAIMQDYGWGYTAKPRHKSRRLYVYAQRRQGKEVVDCYICPLSRLGELTKEELIAKLTKDSVENP
jgi:hypothetical protein